MFNELVAGGVGLAYKFYQGDFALGATFERETMRLLHDGIEVGGPVPGGVNSDGEQINLETISLDDDRFFRDLNSSAYSIKFVYFM